MRKNKLKNIMNLSKILVILIPILLFFISSATAIEKIDSFKSTTNIIIDGKWTTSDEWDNSTEKLFTFGNGTGTAYLRVLNDMDYLYVLVDFVTYNNTKTGDGCIVVIDTKNDGGSSIKSDDLALVIRWNTPSEIYPAMQWGGWESNWVSITSDFELESSENAEYNPYSTDPHLVFEFKIPKDYFEPGITNFGFLTFIVCDNEKFLAALPLLQFSHQPDDWNDLILFNDTIQILNDAEIALDESSDAIEKAESEGRTDGLSVATSLQNQADDTMDLHDYNEATSLANQALTAAEASTIPTQPPEEEDETPGFEFIIIICAIAMILLWKRKNSN